MKALTIYLTLIVLSLTACNNNKSAGHQGNDTLAVSSIECYIAVFDKDTAQLSLSALEGSKIQGDLLIQYHNNPKNEGTLLARRSGDTLFADYSYTVGTYEKVVNKNPLAFLIKGDSLILGIGEIETKVGRSYFKPGVPINFDRGRFRFVKGECEVVGTTRGVLQNMSKK